MFPRCVCVRVLGGFFKFWREKLGLWFRLNIKLGCKRVGGFFQKKMNRLLFQMSQHMAGMNLYTSSGMMGYSSQHMGGGPAAATSTHMTAHFWK